MTTSMLDVPLLDSAFVEALPDVLQADTADCPPRLQRRFLDLAVAYASLQEAFVDLAELIFEYVRSVPREGWEPDQLDRERFLGWLAESYGLTPEQRRHAREAARDVIGR